MLVPDVTISVVTPSLNQGKYLAEAIESVRIQSYPCLEHLVIDAGSTDETLEVLESYRDLKYLKWISEPDKGQSNGLNKGFRMAKGDWILWLNADDWILPGTLEAYARAVQKRPHLDCVYGHMKFVDGHGQPIRTVFHIPYHYSLSKHYLYTPPSTGSLFRRDLLLAKPLDESYRYIMDIEWFLRCGRELKSLRLNRVTSCFRLSGTNKTFQSATGHRLPKEHHAEWQDIFAAYGPHPSTYPKRERIGYAASLLRYYGGKLRFGHRYVAQRGLGRHQT